MNIEPYLQRHIQRVNFAIDKTLRSTQSICPRLQSAMAYVMQNAGKRLRPILLYATGEALGVPLSQLDAAAVAIECIHTYSLVHDDLPAMDDDAERRGKPSCHIAYDEATAILVGDTLQALAFEVLSHDEALQCPDQARLEMVRLLSRAIGSAGLVGGQALELTSTQANVALLESIHEAKTGALFGASMALAALCHDHLDLMAQRLFLRVGQRLGLAFQIQDDLQDSETEATNSLSYVALVGQAAAQQRITNLYSETLNDLAPLDDRAKPLRALIDYLAERHTQTLAI